MPRLTVALALLSAAHAEPITFYRNIAPIVYQSCAPCHRAGAPGPFPLISYQDVQKHAAQIVPLVKRRYMPPWLPETGYGHFQEERRLSDEQIRTIEAWVRAGAPAGSPADAPPMPHFVPGWQLGKPDLIIEATAPYHLSASGPDEYWNFVLPFPASAARWVKAIEIRPGNLRAVHHCNLLIDRAHSARAQELKPGAGFAGMDLSIESDVFDPDSHFLFWKPGGAPWVEPAGLAWRADPNMDLVLNVHMQPTGKPELVQPSVGLYFTDQPATKFPMLLQLERDGSLDIPPGAADFQVADDFLVPMDMDLLAVYPHAHYLGKMLDAWVTMPGGAHVPLIRIPNWDPNWQSVYRYAEPVFLPKGAVISMRYHYDNSAANPRNPNQPPKRVRGGNQATDEMAHLWLQVLPRGSADRRMELEEAIMQHRLEKYPGDFTAQFNIGALKLASGDRADAVTYLRGAITTRPDHPVALNTLGAALLAMGNVDDAELLFTRALAANPKYTNARFNLASALAEQRHWDRAADEFRRVLAADPGDEAARRHLGEVLRLWGDDRAKAGSLEEAAAHLRESLGFRPDDAALHSDLGTVLARLGRLREAMPEFEAALRLDPQLESARHNLEAARALLSKSESR